MREEFPDYFPEPLAFAQFVWAEMTSSIFFPAIVPKLSPIFAPTRPATTSLADIPFKIQNRAAWRAKRSHLKFKIQLPRTAKGFGFWMCSIHFQNW